MIDWQPIQELLVKKPFRELHIRMSDGKCYDVGDPALAVAMVNYVFLAMPDREHFKMLSYENMTCIIDGVD